MLLNTGCFNIWTAKTDLPKMSLTDVGSGRRAGVRILEGRETHLLVVSAPAHQLLLSRVSSTFYLGIIMVS
jgi:hypothetical protein